MGLVLPIATGVGDKGDNQKEPNLDDIEHRMRTEPPCRGNHKWAVQLTANDGKMTYLECANEGCSWRREETIQERKDRGEKEKEDVAKLRREKRLRQEEVAEDKLYEQLSDGKAMSIGDLILLNVWIQLKRMNDDGK